MHTSKTYAIRVPQGRTKGLAEHLRDDMRSDTIIEAADLTITLTGETNTYATVTIDGREYDGEVGSPVGKDSPDQWIDWSLLRGMYKLSDADFTAVCNALSDAMQ